MKPRPNNRLSLALAAVLPCMPLLRSALPAVQSAAPSTWAIIFRWAAGGLAMFGYHAISSASSIAISPASATIGVPYSGTITYSGGHAGSVLSMKVNGTCLGTYTLVPGLTVRYNGVNTASVTGTPTGGLGTVGITVTAYDGYSCTGGLTDTRSTSFIVQSSGGGPVGPTMTVAPQGVLAQVSSDVLLSGGASGNPTPQYYWKQGITFIPGATNNILLLPAAQLANAGVYTLVASNSQGQANSACDVTMALTPGSNILAYQYTNHIVAGTALTMSSLITNVPAATNTYSWQYNNGNIGVTTSNLTLTPAQTIPSKSGVYAVTFNSLVGTTVVVNQQQYISYWAFGYAPTITSPPAGQAVNAGSNVTFNITLTGTTPTLLWYQNQTNLVATQDLAFNPTSAATTTNASLTLSNVSAANAGNYTVSVTNFYGATLSSSALLTVIQPLSVTSPQSQTNYAGEPVGLSVTATGAAPLAYQWQKGGVNLSNGGPISGANTNRLILFPASTANNGAYQVVVTNNSGRITSTVATLSIVPVPSLALSTGPGGANLSSTGAVVGSTYVVQVSTNLANHAAWVPLKTNLVLSANGTINFTDITPTTAGQNFYRLQFPASFTFVPPLSVTSPQSQTNYAGEPVSLSVTATGAAPLAYQWQKGGINLSNGGPLSGANTNTLRFSPASTTNSGNYQVVVTDSSGSLTSGVAILSIVPVPHLALATGPTGATLSAAGAVVGNSYVVQVSTNLANPAAWVPLQTNLVPANGAINFTQTNPPTSGQHFYRLQFP